MTLTSLFFSTTLRKLFYWTASLHFVLLSSEPLNLNTWHILAHTFHSLIAQSSVFLWMFDEELVFVIPWQCLLSLHRSLSLPEVACAIVGLMWRGHLPAPLNKMGNETSTSELPVRRFQLGPAAWLSTAVFVSSETLRLPCLCVP